MCTYSVSSIHNKFIISEASDSTQSGKIFDLDEYVNDYIENFDIEKDKEGGINITSKKNNLTYKKLTLNDVRQKIDENYDLDFLHKCSSAFDIIASYLKGQKIIYMEARSYTIVYLYILMIPAIFITAFCSVAQSPLKELVYGNYILAGLNGFLTFLLSIISFMKLDASAQAYKITAHQYDKLQSFVEFQSGKLLFLDNKRQLDKYLKKIEEDKNRDFQLHNKQKYNKKKKENTNLYENLNNNNNNNIPSIQDNNVCILCKKNIKII